MDSDRRKNVLLFSSSSLVLLGICGFAYSKLGKNHPAPPIAIATGKYGILVENNGQVIRGRSDAKIHPKFTVRNSTEEIVKLGIPSSSCGCTIASITSRQIPPGMSVDVTLDTIPPQSGMRKIQVDIPIISPESEKGVILLSLDVIGYTPVPYLETMPTSLRFGFLDDNESVITGEIITRENRSSPPAAINPRWTESILDVKVSFNREVDMGNGVVQRAYRLRTKFLQQPPAGLFKDSIAFPVGDDSFNIPTLECTAEVRPQITVSPSSLYASLDPGDPLPEFVVVFSFNNKKITEIIPPSNLDHAFEIRQLGEKTGPTRSFIIKLKKRPDQSTAHHFKFSPLSDPKMDLTVRCQIKVAPRVEPNPRPAPPAIPPGRG